MMGLRPRTDFKHASTCLSIVLRLCVLVVSVKCVSICFAADPDSTGVQPVVSVSVDSTAVDSILF